MDVIDTSYSTYECEWFSVRGRENELAAREAFDTYLEAVKQCATAPHTVTIKEFVDARGVSVGQEANIADPYPGMPENRERYVEVAYRFWSHWWIISLKYGFYDGTP